MRAVLITLALLGALQGSYTEYALKAVDSCADRSIIDTPKSCKDKATNLKVSSPHLKTMCELACNNKDGYHQEGRDQIKKGY